MRRHPPSRAAPRPRPAPQRPWVTLLRRDFEPRRDVYRPVFSERTYCGRAVEYVLQTLVGRGCISPVGGASLPAPAPAPATCCH